MSLLEVDGDDTHQLYVSYVLKSWKVIHATGSNLRHFQRLNMNKLVDLTASIVDKILLKTGFPYPEKNTIIMRPDAQTKI